MAGSRRAAWLLGPAAFGGARQPAQYLNSEVETGWAARRHGGSL